ncbi:MAG: acetoacetate--CoA ligase, partial [Mesorhizobium sp.]
MQTEKPLWIPSQHVIDEAPLTAFMEFCSQRFERKFEDIDEFHSWSVTESGDFWSGVWDFCGVVGSKGEVSLVNDDVMLDARFFPAATLNFAENLLRYSGEGDALVFRGEDKARNRMSW